MAQSTEDYLDSLLRQAMGIPDPEPEKKPEETVDLQREDVLAMAEGLTGSNSAILGNAYDHNASFTNEGEIEHAVSQEPVSDVTADSLAAEPISTEPISSEPISTEPISTEPISTESISTEPIFVETPEISDVATETFTEMTAEPIAEPTVEEAVEPVIIPDGPMIEHDGNLDIIPEPSMMDEIPLPEPEIPAVEEPVIEEPVIGEPVITEPAAEEIPMEEIPMEEIPMEEIPMEEVPSAVEEPVISEEPAVNEELDQAEIEAMLAAAAAEPVAEEPAVEEPAIEEPAVEEAVIEEPAIEEPAVEEPVIEEPAVEEAAVEEPTVEEPAAEEEIPAADETDIIDPFADSDMDSLEALDISLGDPEEAPLMPDQEISDLLSTLGEISGEGGPEEAEEGAEEASEEAPEEGNEETSEEGSEEGADEAPSAEAEGEAADADTLGDLGVDGIDMFDTDLSAMLDDVTNNLGSGEEAAASDDADLNDLLGSLDDGSGDLSDIGNLLEKDENSELVDPNTETAEALFASGSEDEIFDIDNLMDEEEEPKKKKKKKGFSLFGKKKKKGDSDIEVLGGEEEMLIDPELLDIPEKVPEEKKVGFFGRLLAKLFEEVDEGADDVSGIEQNAVDIAAEGAAENEAILSELEGEEAADGKKDKKKKKEKKKKDKKDKKGGGDAAGEGDEGEEGAEEPKKKKKEKKEKKKKEKLPELPGKRLPRKKVVAIALFCITIGIVITFLAFLLPYSQDIKKAKKFYTTGEYQKTYEYMRGHKLTSDDQILYDRTVTLLRIKRPYDSYMNYMKMGLRMEALNALVQGVQMTDKYAEEAARLGIIDKYSKQSRLIYDELYNTFGVSVDMARSWIELEGTPEYTRALYGALVGSSGSAADIGADEADEASASDFSFDVDPNADPIINAEENDL